MKIVIPTDDYGGLQGKVAEHFGRCKTYTFLDETGKIIEVIENTSEHMGGTGLPPELMKRHNADILLCKTLGPRALELCKKIGIEVHIGELGTVGEMFDAWKRSATKKAESDDICGGHTL